jgi:hypothetical protein
MTPGQLLRAIRTRAALAILGGASKQDAELQAARQLLREGVELPKAADKPQHHHTTITDIRDTLVDAFAKLIAREEADQDANLSRFRDRSISPPPKAAEPTTRTLVKLKRPPPPRPSSKAAPSPIIGVYVNGPTGAQLIDDSEYHSSILASPFSRTTASWRKSIAENERIERERREAWAVRLAEIKRQQ